MTYRHSSFFSKSIGAEIHRLTAEPDSGDSGTILALHGLGDHVGCHHKAFELFGDLGYRVEAFDWPGNGKSAGKRGDIPGVKPAINLTREVLEQLPEPPIGFYAHSTGGFIAFPFLSRYAAKIPLQWAWVSSPLLRPTYKQSKAKIVASEILADFVPKLTVPTGVTPSRCFHVSDFDALKIKDEFKDCHSKISVRFGRDLMMWEQRVATAATRLEDPLRLLMTQGDEDTICPPEFAEDLFETIPLADKSFVLLEQIRHEPLREPENHIFLDSVREWLVANPALKPD